MRLMRVCLHISLCIYCCIQCGVNGRRDELRIQLLFRVGSIGHVVSIKNTAGSSVAPMGDVISVKNMAVYSNRYTWTSTYMLAYIQFP